MKSNIRKYFVYLLTNRRNYIPILSIYFLTLPNALAQQIGVFTGIGWFAGFLFEIPSGYLSDIFGHKKTLIVAKFCMIISTLFFSFGGSLPYFIGGSIFMSLAIAFTSGTAGAFLHNTLVALGRENKYAETKGKIAANVSLVSAAIIILLPFLTKIEMVLPIKIYLIFDVIGIIVAYMFISPPIEYSAEDEEGEKIWAQLKRFRGTGFYTTSLFLGLLGGFVMGSSMYKMPYLDFLGFPVILVGTIMAGSRVVWFIIGHHIHILKKTPIKKLILLESLFFPLMFIAISLLRNPYVIGVLLMILSGYFHARRPIIQEYYLNHFLINKKYKATMLSIKAQIGQLLQSGMTFVIGIAMGVSFSFGYLITGIVALVLLLVLYPFVKRIIK